MTAPDPVGHARSILSDAPGLVTHPGLVGALVSGRASSFQVRVVDSFVSTLELAKQIDLARQAGAHLDLSPADKAFLDATGTRYDDVDAARLVQHPPEVPPPAHPGFWGHVGGFLATAGNAILANPVTRPVLHGLGVAADVAKTPYRLAEE